MQICGFVAGFAVSLPSCGFVARFAAFVAEFAFSWSHLRFRGQVSSDVLHLVVEIYIGLGRIWKSAPGLVIS